MRHRPPPPSPEAPRRRPSASDRRAAAPCSRAGATLSALYTLPPRPKRDHQPPPPRPRHWAGAIHPIPMDGKRVSCLLLGRSLAVGAGLGHELLLLLGLNERGLPGARVPLRACKFSGCAASKHGVTEKQSTKRKRHDAASWEGWVGGRGCHRCSAALPQRPALPPVLRSRPATSPRKHEHKHEHKRLFKWGHTSIICIMHMQKKKYRAHGSHRRQILQPFLLPRTPSSTTSQGPNPHTTHRTQ